MRNLGKLFPNRVNCDSSDTLPNIAGGDMSKSVYDADNDGKVDVAEDSEKLGSIPANLYALKTDLTGTIGSAVYTHNQSVPNSVWTITHNLLKLYPSITVIDSAGDEIAGGDVDPIDFNSLTITFGASFGGTAYLQ